MALTFHADHDHGHLSVGQAARAVVLALLRVTFTLLFILLVAVAVCESLGWPFLRAPAEAFLQQKLQRPARLAEPFSLHLLGQVRLQLGGLWISAPEGFSAPHLVDANRIGLELRYADLMNFYHGAPLHIARLDTNAIDAWMIRRRDGATSWAFSSEPQAQKTPMPEIDDIRLHTGKLVWRDPRQEADLRATFTTEEGKTRKVAKSRVEAEGTLRGHPLRARIETPGFLPILNATSSTVVTSVAWIDYGGVRVDFDGTLSDWINVLNIHGKVAVKGPSLAVAGRLIDAVLPTTDPFALSGTLDKQGKVWETNVKSASIGQSRLSGHFRYDTGPAVPRLSGRLNGERLYLADLGPAFGTRDENGKRTPPPTGRVLPDRKLDLPSLKKMDARIAIDLKYVDPGSLFAQPFTPLAAELTLEDGKLTLDKINARTARGSITGELSIDPRPKLPHWHADLAWEGIRLQDWIKFAKDRAAKAGKPQPPYFTGALHGRAKLDGYGSSTAQLFASLDGQTSVFIRNGTISHLVIEGLGLDIAQGLGLLLGRDESLRMDCAVVRLQARDGILTPDVALVDTPVTLALSDGRINLANEQLALRLTARPKNVSPLTLRTPIYIKGTFLKPDIKLDKGPIAFSVIASLVLATVHPLAAILPLIDLGAKTPDTASCRQTVAAMRAERIENQKPAPK